MAPRREALSIESLHLALRERPSVPAREVLRILGVIPATLSRVVAGDEGRTVLRSGAARATRYTLIRDVRDLGGRWPFFRIDANGRASRVGELIAGQGRDFFVLADTRALPWLTAESDGGRFSDLPWYLQDLRPAGFLGRAFARMCARDLSVPADPRDWTTDDHLSALLRRGDDLPGDFVLGAGMADLTTTQQEPEPVSIADYAGIARRVTDGEIVGSSAAGEQPKFGIYARTEHGSRHVLVKFATMATENGRRAADLLVAEHRALELLSRHNLTGARSHVRDLADMRFLEVGRFDRVGTLGRRSMIALSSIDAHFAGVGHGWTAAARRLADAGILTQATAHDVARLDAFGAAIANSDRHFGNLSFHIDTTLPATLCPVYDMLPMAFAAGPQGPRPYAAVPISWPSGASADVVAEARTLARAYWSELGQDPRVSADFRTLAASMAE